MKAGIITFHYAHHYGAQLQAYALMKTVAGMGIDCEIINYVRKDTMEGSSLFKKGLSPRALLSNANTLLNYKNLRRRYDKFNDFVNIKMKLSGKFYGSYHELAADSPQYDAYICGSDQIWNPLIYEEKTFDPAFFAEFAQSGRRIAYAPSFGVDNIPECKKDELKRYLDKFDRLSVRETAGEKIIYSITGRKPLTVLDPTLLPAECDWEKISIAPSIEEPYLLCYFITDGRKYSGYTEELSERFGLPIVSLCGSRMTVSNTRYSIMDAGPEEFLGLFKNASFICTDSFHGTVFSIIFRKDFLCFKQGQATEKSVNSRLYSILDKLGLLSRIIAYTGDKMNFKEKLDDGSNSIDYGLVERRLANERELSVKFLEEALKD